MIYTPPKTNGSSLFRILPTLTARSPKMRVLVQMMFLFNGVILRFKMWNFRGVDDGLGVVVSILFAYIVSICWALSKNDNSALGTGTPWISEDPVIIQIHHQQKKQVKTHLYVSPPQILCNNKSHRSMTHSFFWGGRDLSNPDSPPPLQHGKYPCPVCRGGRSPR